MLSCGKLNARFALDLTITKLLFQSIDMAIKTIIDQIFNSSVISMQCMLETFFDKIFNMKYQDKGETLEVSTLTRFKINLICL